MTTQSSPVITDMKVIPVAGHDSMLLNIGGAHNAYFTRNIVVLTDNAGHTGIGEAPGGEVIYQTLVGAIPMVLGQEVARLNKVVQQVHKGNQAADFDTFGKGAWTFELRVNAVAALEAALLDLLGQALNVPVCELLGPGKQRDAITVLGYLFYIGDRTKTDLPYLENTPGNHEWYQLRHQKAMNSEAVVRLAEASQDRYGFKDFKLKGGVLPGEQEIDTVRALKKRFPDARITVDPNGAWLLDEAISLCKGLNDVLTQSPSAGFELLRFGRVINTEHETLIPANAPLWRTVSYPGGQGVINLAADVVTKFSDGDFPHWSGWRLVDDDADSNSQCNSVILRGGGFTDFRQMICHFPLEWCNTGIEARYGWLKEGVIQERQENEANSDLSLGTDYYRPNNVEYNTTGDSHGESPQSAISEMPDLSYEQSNAYENAVRVLLLGEEDWQTLVKHIKALCFDTSSIAEGRVWHFNPGEFIKHFRKCGWVDKAILKRIFASGTNDRDRAVIEQKVDIYGTAINIVMNKYIMNSPLRRAHFLGQGAVESSRLRSMQEKSQYQTVDENGRPVGGGIVPDSLRDENSDLGHWYGAIETEVDGYFSGVKYNSGGGRIAGSYDWILGNCDTEDAQKFRGRGFKQLTGRSNYAEYWVYRAWIDTNSFTAKWWEDPLWRLHDRRRLTRIPANIEEPHRVTRSEYNCIDTGGFFIVKTVDRRGTRSSITRAMDQDSEVIHLNNTTIDTTDEQTIRSVSRAINGGENGLPDRITFTRAAKKVLI